jgi:DNA (cytosine-5)-methyltransferase 1
MRRDKQTCIELFTGAGGLALGVARAGFEHVALVEWDHDACETLRANMGRVEDMKHWQLFEGDVRDFDFRPYADRVTLLAAGAPCQPFSLGGKHKGASDHRNMFPEVFRAVRELRPQAVLLENVKGLLREAFAPYLEYILLQLSKPDLPPKPREDWRSHKLRLQRADGGGLRYSVAHQLVNCADFGVPQRRERVFIVGFRSDLDISWRELPAAHSYEALLYAQWIDGSYWREHGMKKPRTPDQLRSRLLSIDLMFPPSAKRWSTVRDALGGLPPPVDLKESPRVLNHVGNPGARAYPGHTGSPYDLPAKTLKAGDHGVPGGENTLQSEDHSVRYFSVREAARLQTFPDEYEFKGPWSECLRQLGNAVPVRMAQAMASAVKSGLRVAPGRKPWVSLPAEDDNALDARELTGAQSAAFG